MSRRTWHVVVADDNAEDRADIRRLLLQGSEDRLIFKEVTFGSEAIASVDDSDMPPDCMILDYFLPDMEAPAVLSALRDTSGLTRCPVVVLTGATGSGLGHAVLRAGAQDFIAKDWLSAGGLVRAMENASERWLMARELQRGAQALAQREQELRTLIDNTPAVLTRFDAQFRYLYANAAITRATGLAPDHLIGRTQQELGMPAALYLPWQNALTAVFATGLAKQLELSMHCDGALTHQATHFVPEFDADEQIASVLAVSHDITALRQVELAGRESAERLRMALSAGHAGAWSWDIVSGTVIWSPENFHRYGRELSFGQPTYDQWMAYVHAEDLPVLVQQIDDVIAGKTHELRVECRVLHPKLGGCWLLWMGQLETDDAGRPCRMVGINLDISDRKRLEQALRREDRRKDEFLAVLAHELRNPLAALSSGLQILKAATDDKTSVLSVQEMMERQFRHMVRLVDDLLDVSRISNGKIELRREYIPVQTVLEHAVEANQSFLTNAGHALACSIDPQPVMVEGDLTRLAQVVGNLLHNAIKYTPHGGRIGLGMHVETAEVVIHVSDNGAGIPPEMVAHVFDLFAQVDHTLHRAQGGLGIGLNVVAELVGMHGGSVTGHSDGLGLGSTFTVRLPLAGDGAARAQPAMLVGPSQADAPDRLLRVLVVDDNVDAAEAMALMLEMHDCNTVTVHCGLAAVAASQTFMPDMILLDIGLPDIDGYEVATRLRANHATSGVFLVALTGWGSAQDKLRSTAMGFDAHLTKPVDVEAILSLLQAHVAKPASDSRRSPRSLPQ